jgi:glycosyltransferase involved in cell wall biosynthesis
MNSDDRQLIDLIRRSGLLTLDWYLARNPDIAVAGVDPVEHWYFTARTESRNPNFLFSTEDYLKANDDVATSHWNPLAHYILFGEAEGRAPSLHFDSKWYRDRYGKFLDKRWSTALSHYLRHLRDPRISPNRYFDTKYYIEQYPDIAKSQLSPYEHFLSTGVFEGRNPSRSFMTTFYARRNGVPADKSPFTHFLSKGQNSNLVTHPADDRNVFTELHKWTTPGPLFKGSVQASATQSIKTPQVDAFAYYLPQFHPIALNDAVWGTGFTEWRNVARGVPRFDGHYQPRIPRDLGFYDLRSPDAVAEQIGLAQEAGLKGFAFYYYNFDGDRLLDLPLDLFIEIDHSFNFFLVWANENWTKAWDGLDREVIKAQSYKWEALPFIAKDIARHMKDERYYRIEGRPLFVMYRPGLVPDPKRYLGRLRELIAVELGNEPLLFMAQAFGDEDPRPFGLDGAIEFPPHKIGQGLESINSSLKFYDHDYGGQVFSYADFVKRASAITPPPYPLIRTVFPSWDNESRRPGYGMVVQGSTPQKYREWLGQAVRFAKRNPIGGRSIVAINAWNEWCEGAYLEPDVHYGSAYLAETRKVIFESVALPRGESIMLIGHDGYRHGAQLLLYDIARQLKMFGHRVAILLLEGGPLESEYREVCDYFAVVGRSQGLDRVLKEPALQEFKLAITNTVVIGGAVADLKENGIRVISLVHEMSALITERSLQPQCEAIARHSDIVVYPAECVRNSFKSIQAIQADKTRIMPQGIYNLPSAPPPPRKRNTDPVIVNAGYGDLRKGYDLFIGIANHFAENKLPGRFVWVGDIENGLSTWVKSTGNNFVQMPFQKDVYQILNGADLFLLTSREDPFPSVALEALAVGVPVVCFESTGGVSDFVKDNKTLGATVPAFSIPEAAAEIYNQIRSDSVSRKNERVNLVLRSLSFARYVSRLVEELGTEKKSVGVVVPNFNYKNYLRLRVASVLNQTYRPDQLFLLDDCSTDGSQALIAELAHEHKPFIATSFNAKGTGSPVAQWEAGAKLCSTKYVWIAEADDLADASFLESTITFMEENGCDFCFTDSVQIGPDGALLVSSYDYYFRTVDPTIFNKSFVMPGRMFLERLLSQKNIILNVSAVVWNRDVLLQALASLRGELPSYRIAGDWRLYTEVCARNVRIGFVARALNHHRRHAESATHTQKRHAQLQEISSVHRVIRETLGDVEPIRRKQEAYVEELAHQFGLRNSKENSWPSKKERQLAIKTG